MTKTVPAFIVLVTVVVLASASLTTPALATAPAQSANGVVRAVMFWMDGCPHCHYVLDEVLPPLQEKHGERLEIKLVEVASAEDVDQLISAAASFGIPKERVVVPFLVIGEHVLVGSDQIPAELPGLIEAYLASGGVDYPDFYKEANDLATPEPVAQVADSPVLIDSPAIPPRSNGFNLAIAIMIGMVGALVYSGVAFVRGANDSVSEPKLSWRDIAIPVLALVGLGVAAYLAYVETQVVEAVCGPVGDCNAVQTSPYAYLFGVLPIGVLGVIGYLAILAVWQYSRLRNDRLARLAPILIFGMAFFGVLFSLYLTYLEPFVIRAVCIWCLTSAVIMTLLLLVSLKPALISLSSIWSRMPKKKRRKTSSLPKVLIIAGVVLLAAFVLFLKEKPQASTTSASSDELPEAQLVNALQAGQPTLAFYHSTNCKQCIVMMDIVGKVYPEFVGAITLVDIDVYDERNVPLLQEVGLQYIPTLMFYNQAGERQVHVGVMEVDQLRQTLASMAGGD